MNLQSYACLPRSVTVSSAPAAEPISATTAKLHCKIDTTADDALVTTWIADARRMVELLTGRALITQTHVARYDSVPSDGAPLLVPRAPVQSVTSVVTYNVSNVAATFAAASYLADLYSDPVRLALNDGYDWPSDLRAINALEVTYVAGYGLAGTAVPEPLLDAMLLLIAHRAENREPSLSSGAVPQEVPLSVQWLIGPYRVWWL